MPAPEIAFALTSAIDPPKKFTLDGDPYELRGINHLTPTQEAEAMALFARHSILAQELELTKNTTRGEEIAMQMRTCRLRIIHKLTTIPETVELPLHVQVTLLEAVRVEMEIPEDAEDAARVPAADREE